MGWEHWKEIDFHGYWLLVPRLVRDLSVAHQIDLHGYLSLPGLFCDLCDVLQVAGAYDRKVWWKWDVAYSTSDVLNNVMLNDICDSHSAVLHLDYYGIRCVMCVDKSVLFFRYSQVYDDFVSVGENLRLY